MEEKDLFDFGAFEAEALSKLREAKPLEGSDGVLASAAQTAAVGQLGRGDGRPSGRSQKQVQSSIGPVDLEQSRDWLGNFEPELVGKGQRQIGRSLENKILSLYGLGMKYTAIQDHLQELYGLELSRAKLSAITDKVSPGRCKPGEQGLHGRSQAGLSGSQPDRGPATPGPAGKKMGQRYQIVIDSWWSNNRDMLSEYFDYAKEIRPREALEGYHRQIRKITKSKGAFTSEKSLMKLVYPVQLKISEKMDPPHSQLGSGGQPAEYPFWRPNKSLSSDLTGAWAWAPAGTEAPVKTLTQLIEHSPFFR